MSRPVRTLLIALSVAGLALVAQGCCGGKEIPTASARCRATPPNNPACDACCKSESVGAKYGTYSGGECHCY
jgi:hypothetical protein